MLERATPGENIKTVFCDRRERSIDAMICVLKKLVAGARPKQYFIHLDQWTRKLEQTENYTDFPREYADRARSIFSRSNLGDDVLLHGDLHHTNVLSHGDTFVAIDPKGIIGNVKYDIGVLLNNHYGWIKHMPNTREQMANAVDKFAVEFDQSPPDIREWAFAQKVLSAYWSMTESDQGWQRQLEVADIWGL